MKANDEHYVPVSSASSGSTAEPAGQFGSPELPDKLNDDRSWLDTHTIKTPPPISSKAVRIDDTDFIRSQPMPYPDICGDDEDCEPIDVHSLNVVPGKELFTFTAKLHYLGKMEPLPYPDPLGDREEEADD